jgi:Flp pilus assembly protein TadG
VSAGGRLRDESGQSALELSGTLLWLLLAAVLAWQLALVGWTVVSAGNAARTAARLVSRGDSTSDARSQGIDSLASKGLPGAQISFTGSTSDQSVATAHVQIPILLPGLKADWMWITQKATMPVTG